MRKHGEISPLKQHPVGSRASAQATGQTSRSVVQGGDSRFAMRQSFEQPSRTIDQQAFKTMSYMGMITSGSTDLNMLQTIYKQQPQNGESPRKTQMPFTKKTQHSIVAPNTERQSNRVVNHPWYNASLSVTQPPLQGLREEKSNKSFHSSSQ